MPDLVLVIVGAERPAEHHRVEGSLIDEVLQKDGPFIELDLHFYAQLPEVVLHKRGDVPADFVSVIGDQSESKSLAILFQDAVLARLPAGFGEQLPRLLRVVTERFYVGIEKPHFRGENPGALDAVAVE